MSMLLIRGLPGSGKTTLALEYATAGFVHCEADQYFVCEDGIYRYNPDDIGKAHLYCQEKCLRALVSGKSVVVSNTFTRLSEMDIYRMMAEVFDTPCLIAEMRGKYQNVHGVPIHILEAMAKRWEPCSFADFYS